MDITTETIKQLRDLTGVSVMQCKKALEEAGGDLEKAKIILRKHSSAVADKKGDRELGAGIVASYIHSSGTVGVMVELLCETDFVAKNEEFKTLAKEIAMHTCASNPEFIRASEISSESRTKAEEIFKAEAKDKPADLQAKIVEGKLEAYFKDKVLLDQPYIKDPERTVGGLIKEAIQKFGEKIDIGRVSRFSISK